MYEPRPCPDRKTVDFIDAIEAAATGLTGVERFCTEHAVGCLWHWKENNGVEDLRKAIKYIEHMIDREERAKCSN